MLLQLITGNAFNFTQGFRKQLDWDCHYFVSSISGDEHFFCYSVLGIPFKMW